MDETAGEWVCRSYEHERAGLCFFAEIRGGEFSCPDEHTCEARLGVWQAELYEQIRTLALTGDPVWTGLADGLDGAPPGAF